MRYRSAVGLLTASLLATGCLGGQVVDQVPTVEFDGVAYSVGAPSGFVVGEDDLTSIGEAEGGTFVGADGLTIYSVDGVDPSLLLAIRPGGPEPTLLLFAPGALDPPRDRVSSENVFVVPPRLQGLCRYVDPSPEASAPSIQGCDNS